MASPSAPEAAAAQQPAKGENRWAAFMVQDSGGKRRGVGSAEVEVTGEVEESPLGGFLVGATFAAGLLRKEHKVHSVLLASSQHTQQGAREAVATAVSYEQPVVALQLGAKGFKGAITWLDEGLSETTTAGVGQVCCKDSVV